MQLNDGGAALHEPGSAGTVNISAGFKYFREDCSDYFGSLHCSINLID